MKHHYSVRNLFDGTGTFLVFVTAVAGVVIAEYALNGYTWKSTTASIIGAVVLVGRTELRDSDSRGKRSRLLDRLIVAFSHGIALRVGGAVAFGGK